MEKPACCRESSSRSTWVIWCSLALIVLFIAGLRIRLLPIALERDEGEYAYIAQLILQGVTPYSQAYTMKYPGVPYAYAVILALFGQTDVGIHLGLLVVNAISIVLMFLLGARLFTPLLGLFAAGVFGLLSLDRTMLGFTANAEHFVLLPMLAATLILLRAVERRQQSLFLASGILFGLAILMKQHAAAFAAFGVVYFFVQARVRESRSWLSTLLHLLLLSGGIFLPLLLLGLYLWRQGTFAPFWFWTFTYPRHYTSMVSFSEGLTNLTREIVFISGNSAGLWVLAVVGVTAMIWDETAKSCGVFLKFFAGFSFLSICPGLLFRSHYFLLLVPTVSLLAGLGAAALGRLCQRFLPPKPAGVGIVFIAATLAIVQQYHYLFLESPKDILQVRYSGNPFDAMKEIALYVQANSKPEDRMAILGSEPEMYFYARRRAATRCIYVYPLMKPQPYALQMQKDMISEIEGVVPRFIVIVRARLSWLPNPDSPRLILEWPKGYVATHYHRVCVADTLPSGVAEYHWNSDAILYTPRGQSFVVLYERSHVD